MDATVALIRMAQPAIDRYFACHPSIRFWILSTKYWYELVVLRVVKIGVPRYMPMRWVVGMPKMPTTWSFICLGIQGENQIRNLVALIICPDEALKVCRIVFSYLQSLVVAFVNRKMSSAKNKWERWTRPRKDVGFSSLSWTASSRRMDKHSKHKIKR